MAKAKLEFPFAQISGKIDRGSNTYYATRLGQTIVSHYPVGKNPESVTPLQKEKQASFLRAVAEADRQLADTQLRRQWMQRFEEQKNSSSRPYKLLRNFVIASLLTNTQPQPRD
ncbi:MAG: hypothetical protein K5660_09840 [Paludibacteraceae bacterium]|nr:hypothetical protein [Paludibacteraceae bacterium]